MVRALVIAILVAFGAHHTEAIHLVGAAHDAHACVTCVDDTPTTAGLDLALCLAVLAAGIAIATRRFAARLRVPLATRARRGPTSIWRTQPGLIPRPPPAPVLLCVLRR